MRHLDLEDKPSAPQTINVDGTVLDNGYVCWGKANRRPNGKYECIANCGGVLALIEVIITIGKVNQEPPFQIRPIELD